MLYLSNVNYSLRLAICGSFIRLSLSQVNEMVIANLRYLRKVLALNIVCYRNIMLYLVPSVTFST